MKKQPAVMRAHMTRNEERRNINVQQSSISSRSDTDVMKVNLKQPSLQPCISF